MTEELKTWVGSSIEEIMSGITIETIQQAPKVEISETHTILFQLPFPNDENEFPIPAQGEDKWDDDHVKLPCSSKSVYKEINADEEQVTKSRWDFIKESLSRPIQSCEDLEKAIKSYNNKFEKVWNFKSLYVLLEEEFTEDDSEFIFDELLPAMIKLAFDIPNLFQAPIPLLRQKSNHSISMSQQQAACLLANAFFCTFPNRSKRNSDYPEINFNRLFCSEGAKIISKLKCILNYFRAVLLNEMPKGVLTFQRRYIETFPDWSKIDDKFSSIKWHINSKGTIEEGRHMLQVDFANRYLGGGVLGNGCVQEEIRFMINPECIVGMLFCECMKSDEAIYIYGTEQFSNYKGYASSFEYAGNNKDRNIERDIYRRKLEHIVAIDALSFHKPTMQFKELFIKRELNKAFCGFYSSDKTYLNIPIATGNWGCGAFRGYNRLKCLIQLMACVANRRNLVYYTFNDFELQLEMEEMFEFLQDNDITVAQLWKYLIIFNPMKDYTKLYRHIRDQFLAEKELEGVDSAAFESSQDVGGVDSAAFNSQQFEKIENTAFNSQQLLDVRMIEGSDDGETSKLEQEFMHEEEPSQIEEDLKQQGQVSNQQEETSQKEDCVIDIPDSTEEVLENPTKKMKIDDGEKYEKVASCSTKNEIINQTGYTDDASNDTPNIPLEPPPKNKLITDYFTKNPK